MKFQAFIEDNNEATSRLGEFVQAYAYSTTFSLRILLTSQCNGLICFHRISTTLNYLGILPRRDRD
jgi:hypothetical protein